MANLEVKVLDAEGRPVKGAKVHVYEHGGKRDTDASGKVVLPDVEVGHIFLHVLGGPGGPQEVEPFKWDGDDVTLQIVKGELVVVEEDEPGPGPGPGPGELKFRVGPNGEIVRAGLDRGFLVCVGNYVSASYAMDHEKLFDIVGGYGIELYRTFSSLPRDPHGKGEENYLSPWNSTARYTSNLLSLIRAAKARGIVVLYCLFDEVTRTDKAPESLRDRKENTFNGREPSSEVVRELSQLYLGRIPIGLRDAVAVEAMNEPPGDGPTWTQASDWNRIVEDVARSLAYGNALSFDYSNHLARSIRWEHARPEFHSGGKLTLDSNKQIEAALKAHMAAPGPIRHVGLSTDGIRVRDILAARDLFDRVFGLGCSVELMTADNLATTWGDTEKRAVEAMLEAAEAA